MIFSTLTTADLSIIMIVFAFGSSIGSFLNVCIYRIPNHQSIVTPGSFCPNCRTAIPFYYNIPVIAYLILRGRCRFCNVKISMRYFWVECLTGCLSVLLLFKFGLSPAFFFWFIFICVLITISFIDFDHQIIPDIISLPGILIFSSSFYFLPEMHFLDVVYGILAGGGSLLAVAYLYYLIRKQEGMGGGDIKLLAMIGAATGLKGVIFTMFAGSLAGTIVGLCLMIFYRQSDMKFKIPFGPYLSLGALCYIFYGEALISWYLSLLGPY